MTMKIKRSEFSCMREGLRILGTEFRPDTGERLPIAIVSHEFMCNRLFTARYALMFAKLGFAAFCFDFCGGCIVGASGGRTTDMSVMTEMKDLKAVIDYAESLPYTDADRLVLMGCSQGGLVSALTAAELGDAGVEYDGFVALDISFVDAAGNKVEPLPPVSVNFTLPAETGRRPKRADDKSEDRPRERSRDLQLRCHASRQEVRRGRDGARPVFRHLPIQGQGADRPRERR